MSSFTANPSRAGLLFGAAALLVALFPFAAAEWSAASLMGFYFLIPLTAVALGLMGLFWSTLSLRHSDKPDAPKPTPDWGWFGIILNVAAILLGGSTAAFFAWFTFGMKAPLEDAPGDLQVFFYGEPDQREMAIQSIYLPDSTLLTSGFGCLKSDHTSGSGFVMKTSLSGEKRALFDASGTMGKISINPDGVIINARARPYPADSSIHYKELALYKLIGKGGVIAERVYPLGNDGGIGDLQPSIQGGFLLNGTYDWIEGDSTRQSSYVTRFTDHLDTLWWREYSSEYVGRLRNLTPTADGGCLLLGFRDKPEGSTEISDYLKLSRLDAEGNLLWSGVSFAASSLSASRAIEQAEGGFILLSQRKRKPDGVEGVLTSLSSTGETLWSKAVTDKDDEVLADFIPWVNNGFLIVGWASRKEAKMRLTTAKMRFWDTFVIIETDAEGAVTKRFTGGKTQFAAWGVTRIDQNTAAVTGFGSKGPQTVYQNEGAPDVGIMIYQHEWPALLMDATDDN